MKNASRILSPYLLLTIAACAGRPVELGYGTDSSALSDTDATGASSIDEGCGCDAELQRCIDSGELEMQCLGEQLRCTSENPRCSADGAATGELSMELDPCSTRYKACFESREPDATCSELYRSCRDATGATDLNAVTPPAPESDPCGMRYQACYESRQPDEVCSELYSSCRDAMFGADAYRPQPAMQTDPCGTRYQSCRELGEPDEVCGELYSSCSLALRDAATAAAPQQTNPDRGGREVEVRIR